jgi:hypothetical protein
MYYSISMTHIFAEQLTIYLSHGASTIFSTTMTTLYIELITAQHQLNHRRKMRGHTIMATSITMMPVITNKKNLMRTITMVVLSHLKLARTHLVSYVYAWWHDSQGNKSPGREGKAKSWRLGAGCARHYSRGDPTSSDATVQFGPVQRAFCLNPGLDLWFGSEESSNLGPSVATVVTDAFQKNWIMISVTLLNPWEYLSG